MVICETPITWDRALWVVKSNNLQELYRNAATTDKYRVFREECKSQGLTVVRYIIKNRLQWVNSAGEIDTTPRTTSELFSDPEDCKIIANDFPYNFVPEITHLVAWTKLDIPSDPDSEIGDVSDRTRAVIDRYIHKTFVDTLGCPKEDVVWFRNFPSLQSILELSHVHVLIRNMSKEQYDRVINTSGSVLEESEYALI